MQRSMIVTFNKESEVIEKNLTFLATSGSTAPFIGLFGTVWGIMNSFQSIAIAQNTNLAVVAPGIAEALFATALGLFVAIPAVVAYNKITRDLSRPPPLSLNRPLISIQFKAELLKFVPVISKFA